MLNNVVLMGRLTKQPEIQTTASGMEICKFTLAVDRGYAKAGEEKQTDFINIVAFKNTAIFVSRYFTKGQLIAVCGRLQTRTWDDSEGRKHYAMEVLANEVHFAEPKRDNKEQSNIPNGFTLDIDDSDTLPF